MIVPALPAVTCTSCRMRNVVLRSTPLLGSGGEPKSSGTARFSDHQWSDALTHERACAAIQAGLLACASASIAGSVWVAAGLKKVGVTVGWGSPSAGIDGNAPRRST